MNKIASEIRKLLTSVKKISILTHRNPDGDAIGATVALMNILKIQGYQVNAIIPNVAPMNLQWMPAYSELIDYEKNKGQSNQILLDSDVIFTLDFNHLSRVGSEMQTFLEDNIKTTYVMVDHHENPDNYASHQYVETKVGSTCELLYCLFEQMDWLSYIDKDIASCMYVGIVTDSGSFKYPRTTSQTHTIAAKLIEKGVDNINIHTTLFDQNEKNKIELLGYALHKMVILEQYGTAYIMLSKKELQALHYQRGFTEGIVNFGLSIKGINFACIFTESIDDDYIKISFRSIGDFAANQFSQKYFSGGGHINAAGGRYDGTLEELETYFTGLLDTHKEDILNSK